MSNQKYVLPLTILVIATSIGSCSSPFNSTPSNIHNEPPKPAITRTKPDPTLETPTTQTTDVTLYISDLQCQELIPETVSLAATDPISGAVGKIIEQQDTADFGLSGYRVQIQGRIATVDLRLSPLSKRQFVSLSSCEQFALFGSIRKTLMSHPKWQIKEVRFTEQGEEIIL
jgi:hypothetical protein